MVYLSHINLVSSELSNLSEKEKLKYKTLIDITITAITKYLKAVKLFKASEYEKKLPCFSLQIFPTSLKSCISGKGLHLKCSTFQYASCHSVIKHVTFDYFSFAEVENLNNKSSTDQIILKLSVMKLFWNL